ncbi:MAG: tRNA pseudouridine(55) synthase TruB [Schwartzia sp.]|nr:tRNA pseudouridine(55) synthase TruB [Schwartzia sp. (in: firmicutes)]
MRDGFINFLKPPGMTSHDAVGFVRRTLGLKKAGHAGTLDPGAAGVLPIAVGRATRLLEYVGGARKAYRAELRFGAETDSGDDLGEIVAESGSPMPDDEAVARAVCSLTGEIEQTPPIYSAVKIGGRRACDLARKNSAVEMPSRRVTIYRLGVLARNEAEKTLLLDVECSKGTYIRALCRDLGRAAGVPATMSFLVRRAVGDFSLENSRTPEELQAIGEAAVEPPQKYLGRLARYELPEARAKAFLHGLPTCLGEFLGTDGPLAVFSGGIFLGVGRFEQETSSLVAEKVYASQADGKEKCG